MAYTYSKDNIPYKKQHYMYAEYHGKEFLVEYINDRLDALITLALQCEIDLPFYLQKQSGYPKNEFFDSVREFLHFKKSKLQKKCYPDAEIKKNNVNINDLINRINHCHEKNDTLGAALLSQLVKRYEVSRTLYETYLWDGLVGKGPAADLIHYGNFGLALSNAYTSSKNLVYLNALLKVHDSIIGIVLTGEGHPPLFELFLLSICAELLAFHSLSLDVFDEENYFA